MSSPLNIDEKAEAALQMLAGVAPCIACGRLIRSKFVMCFGCVIKVNDQFEIILDSDAPGHYGPIEYHSPPDKSKGNQ